LLRRVHRNEWGGLWYPFCDFPCEANGDCHDLTTSDTVDVGFDETAFANNYCSDCELLEPPYTLTWSIPDAAWVYSTGTICDSLDILFWPRCDPGGAYSGDCVARVEIVFMTGAYGTFYYYQDTYDPEERTSWTIPFDSAPASDPTYGPCDDEAYPSEVTVTKN
jgi:hypothetical protein